MFRKSHDLLIAADMVGGGEKKRMWDMALVKYRRIPWAQTVLPV